MRRLAVLFGVVTLLAAGCGGAQIVAPTAKEVVGPLPKTAAPTKITLPKGNPSKGKALFASLGCSSCHTFKPAGSTATIGPDLDKLAAYAAAAKRGSLSEFTAESIVNPSAYIEPGYQDVMPKTFAKLPKTQIADLVAFLTKK
ncbi:MAG: cytochrome c [Gaiellaceae bacterium]